MGSVTNQLKQKIGFVIAIMLAAVVGGVTTGFVVASIPDANGNLNTCYRNNGGDLRVIDTATDSCGNNETAFNISSIINNSSTAFFRVKNGAVDTASLRNIADYDFVEADVNGGAGWCLEIEFAPLAGFLADLSIVSYGGVFVEGQSNTYDALITNKCSANHNAILVIEEDFYDTVAWFNK